MQFPIFFSFQVHIIMASKPAMRPFQRLTPRATSCFAGNTFRRSLTTSQCPLHQARAQMKPALSRSNLQCCFRRSYADKISPTTKRKGRRVLRWTWRLAYLSAIGGIVYMGYGIYQLRTPPEQLEADPTKKTLVILGMVPNSRPLY